MQLQKALRKIDGKFGKSKKSHRHSPTGFSLWKSNTKKMQLGLTSALSEKSG